MPNYTVRVPVSGYRIVEVKARDSKEALTHAEVVCRQGLTTKCMIVEPTFKLDTALVSEDAEQDYYVEVCVHGVEQHVVRAKSADEAKRLVLEAESTPQHSEIDIDHKKKVIVKRHA